MKTAKLIRPLASTGERPSAQGVFAPLDHQDDDGDEQRVDDQRLDQDQAEDQRKRMWGAEPGLREIPSQALVMALAWQNAPAAAARVMIAPPTMIESL